MISIVIPNYNDSESCEKLAEVIKSQLDGHELIIVDNESEIFPNIEDDTNCNLYVCSKPGSYAARNYGVKKANGEILVFTDSDCIPKHDWLANIQDYYEKYPGEDFILAGNIIVFPRRAGSENIYEAYDCILGLPQRHYVNKGYAITANLSLPKTLFETLGGFDESRYSGGDAELTKKAISQNCRIIYLEDMVVYHPARYCYKQFNNKIKRIIGAQLNITTPRIKYLYMFRNLLPPFIELKRIMVSRASSRLKLKALSFLPLLWLIRLRSLFVYIFISNQYQR